MNRFADVLNQARDRLDIPEPSRTRIVLEMASDLEDSYQYYLDQGHEEAEATRLAKEAFGTSEEALRHLSKVHGSSIGGIADRVSGQAGQVWARFLLVVLVVFEIWLAVLILTEEAFRVYVSPFVWPVAGLAVVAFAFTIWKLVQHLLENRARDQPIALGSGSSAVLLGSQSGSIRLWLLLPSAEILSAQLRDRARISVHEFCRLDDLHVVDDDHQLAGRHSLRDGLVRAVQCGGASRDERDGNLARGCELTV